jgi:hypothetical protein
MVTISPTNITMFKVFNASPLTIFAVNVTSTCPSSGNVSAPVSGLIRTLLDETHVILVPSNDAG